MKRVVVTGATGMLGAALTSLLVSRNVEVVALVSPLSSRLGQLPAESERVKVVPLALGDYEAYARSQEAAQAPRCDVFFHFAWDGTIGAARGDARHQSANADAACQAVRLASALGCRRFVGAGSQAEHGKLVGAFGPDAPCAPVTEYGRAKLQAQARTRELAHELGMDHIWARIGSAYGPGDSPRTVLMSAIDHALRNEPFACTAGEQLWDHIYCDDVAEAFWLMGERGVDGRVYAVGTGEVEPLREHIQLACETARPGFQPQFGAIAYPEAQVMYLRADTAQLVEDTGFRPAVPFKEGIMRTVEWCRARSAATSQSAGQE